MMNNGMKGFEGARITQVIETTITRRGDGVNTPVRLVTQYWSPEGELLAEKDPCPDHEQSIKVLTDAIRWALGENGDFSSKPQDKLPIGKYWWRKELRRRACELLPVHDGVCR